MAKTRARTTRRSTKRPVSRKTGEARSGGRVTIRHYCQGIGDCHLLRFAKADGGDFWMLIDLGVHSSVSGGPDIIDRVVADIATQTRRLDVIVLTHEHTDHISGFQSAADVFKRENIAVGEVWMAWTEDLKDPQAQQLDKFKQQALAALQLTSQRLDGGAVSGRHLSALRSGVDALLGFNFGAKGERVRAYRDAAVALAGNAVRYWEPADPPITVPALPGLRIYVLGPPRDKALLGVTERASEMYQGPTDAVSPAQRALASAFAAGEMVRESGPDAAAPFDANVGTDLAVLAASDAMATPQDIDAAITVFARERYFGPMPAEPPSNGSNDKVRPPDPDQDDQSWRRIDLDWLGISTDLAMQLDDRTNNTSLVLAFEFTDTKRVLLFTGDAQVGNWLSWEKAQWDVDGTTVAGSDLLARTVYYKVGHHGSHNATLKQKGLERMTHRDLSAFVPTNAQDAKKIGWGQMPFPPIIEALAERCAGRVIRADDAWLRGTATAPTFEVPSGSLSKVSKDDGLWVEVEVE
jgi:hypothetical protein